jgi:hypothetical protein
MGGDARDVHTWAAVLDHDLDVEAAQEAGVNVGEVDGEDHMSLHGAGTVARSVGTAAPRAGFGTEEHVRPLETGRAVDVEEVHGQQGRGLSAREPSPRRVG